MSQPLPHTHISHGHTPLPCSFPATNTIKGNALFQNIFPGVTPVQKKLLLPAFAAASDILGTQEAEWEDIISVQWGADEIAQGIYNTGGSLQEILLQGLGENLAGTGFLQQVQRNLRALQRQDRQAHAQKNSKGLLWNIVEKSGLAFLVCAAAKNTGMRVSANPASVENPMEDIILSADIIYSSVYPSLVYPEVNVTIPYNVFSMASIQEGDYIVVNTENASWISESTTKDMHHLGHHSAGHTIHDISVQGDKTALATHTGTHLLNISDPGNINLLDTCTDKKMDVRIALEKKKLFVGNGNKTLYTLDISESGNLAQKDTYYLDAQIRGLDVQGDLALAGTTGTSPDSGAGSSGSVSLYSVQNISDIRLLDQIEYTQNGSLNDVRFVDNTTAVIADANHGLVSIRINPDSYSMNISDYYPFPGAYRISTQGNQVCVSARENGFSIFNISSMGNIGHQGHTNDTDTYTGSISWQGNQLIAVNDANNTLDVFDTTDPSNVVTHTYSCNIDAQTNTVSASRDLLFTGSMDGNFSIHHMRRVLSGSLPAGGYEALQKNWADKVVANYSVTLNLYDKHNNMKAQDTFNIIQENPVAINRDKSTLPPYAQTLTQNPANTPGLAPTSALLSSSAAPETSTPDTTHSNTSQSLAYSSSPVPEISLPASSSTSTQMAQTLPASTIPNAKDNTVHGHSIEIDGIYIDEDTLKLAGGIGGTALLLGCATCAIICKYKKNQKTSLNQEKNIKNNMNTQISRTTSSSVSISIAENVITNNPHNEDAPLSATTPKKSKNSPQINLEKKPNLPTNEMVPLKEK